MSGYRHVIFDCDGVLVDSEPLSNRLEVELARELGMDISHEEMSRRFVGCTLQEQWRALAAEYGVPIPEDIDGWIYARAEGLFRRELKPITGIEAVISGLPVAASVASNSTAALLELKLAVTGLARYFGDRTHSCDSVSRPKPAPDLFLRAAQVVGIAPADCIVVEDTQSGLTAATAAGMTAIGFTGAGHQRPGAEAKLWRAGAFHVANDADALGQILARMFAAAG